MNKIIFQYKFLQYKVFKCFLIAQAFAYNVKITPYTLMSICNFYQALIKQLFAVEGNHIIAMTTNQTTIINILFLL